MSKKQTNPNKHSKQHYVLGFHFNENYSRVVLIQKNRPDWQKGKLNGVGGHIEYNENAQQAMIREFKEETGVDSTWIEAGVFRNNNEVVHIFKTSGNIDDIKTTTDENIYKVSVFNLLDDINSNTMLRINNQTVGVRAIINHLSFFIPLVLAPVVFDITSTKDLTVEESWKLSDVTLENHRDKLYGTPEVKTGTADFKSLEG